MKIQGISYRVSSEGYIDHWLVAGPDYMVLPTGLAIADFNRAELHLPEPDYLEHFRRPVEWEVPLVVGDGNFRWQYQRCLPDHRLDFSSWGTNPQFSRRWLYTEVRQERRETGWIEIEATGDISLWYGRTRLEPAASQSAEGIVTLRFKRPARQGRISLFLCQEESRFGLCPSHIMVKWISSRSGQEQITLPTAVSAKRRKDLQEIIEAAYLDRRVYSRQDPLTIRWPEAMNKVAMLGINMRNQRGESYLEVMHTQATGGTEFVPSLDTAVPDGPYQVQIKPWLSEYYEENQRVAQVLDVAMIQYPFEQTPEREPDERVRLLLESALRQTTNLYSELAKIKLARGSLDETVFQQAIEAMEQGYADAEQALLGLLLIEHEAQQSQTHIEGQAPEMGEHLPCYLPSSHHQSHPRESVASFLESVCRWLSGQRCPRQSFLHFQDRSGSELQEEARQEIQDWILARMTSGFRYCDAEQDLAWLIHACNCLQRLAQDGDIADLALLLMDKTFFSIALNSFRGVYGIASTRANTDALQDARLGALTPLAFWAWGLGGPNSHCEVAVSLINAGYEVPQVIQDIGLFVPDSLWSQELHAFALQDEDDGAGVPERTRRWTYQTPDFMLSSLQEFRPGQRGGYENVWQATLGYDARIHANGPVYISEHEAVPGNFWRGNRTLPWVVQWKEALFAFYPQVEESGASVGFTHAYFPAHAFSEYVLSSPWAFARKDDGYIALFAVNGLDLIQEGQSAYREVRSPGLANGWFCCMGGRSDQESFSEFQARVRQALTMDTKSSTFINVQGQRISYDSGKSLTVDRVSIPIQKEMHYDSPFCQAPFPASEMTIGGLGAQALELRFG